MYLKMRFEDVVEFITQQDRLAQKYLAINIMDELNVSDLRDIKDHVEECIKALEESPCDDCEYDLRGECKGTYTPCQSHVEAIPEDLKEDLKEALNRAFGTMRPIKIGDVVRVKELDPIDEIMGIFQDREIFVVKKIEQVLGGNLYCKDNTPFGLFEYQLERVDLYD